jgi:hypothetical protein
VELSSCHCPGVTFSKDISPTAFETRLTLRLSAVVNASPQSLRYIAASGSRPRRDSGTTACVGDSSARAISHAIHSVVRNGKSQPRIRFQSAEDTLSAVAIPPERPYSGPTVGHNEQAERSISLRWANYRDSSDMRLRQPRHADNHRDTIQCEQRLVAPHAPACASGEYKRGNVVVIFHDCPMLDPEACASHICHARSASLFIT